LELIDELFEGRARCIVLVRHPLDCVESIEEFFSADVKTDPDIARMAEAFGAGRMTWARYWREVYNRIELFTRRPEDRVYLLTYEQLVSAPLPAAQAVFDFLDEQCPESIIEDAFSQPHTGGFQVPKIRSTSGVHGASVGRWRERPLSEARELWQYVSDIADGYG